MWRTRHADWGRRRRKRRLLPLVVIARGLLHRHMDAPWTTWRLADPNVSQRAVKVALTVI
jgi:hypothetical protein